MNIEQEENLTHEEQAEWEKLGEKSESSLNDGLPAEATRWQITDCRKCKSHNGYLIEDARGDAEFTCLDCGFSWWVEWVLYNKSKVKL